MTLTRWLLTCLIAAMGLAGCASAAPATPGLPLPADLKLSGTPLGDGGLPAGDLSIWLAAVEPPTVGKLPVEALILDQNQQPITDATVSYDLDMTNMSHGKTIVPATPIGGGLYRGDVRFMMTGPWRIIVSVERPNHAPVQARFNFSVK